MELSGGGAWAGTNFKNGVELAVMEINAAGGIFGRKIQTTTSDTQRNPGVAKDYPYTFRMRFTHATAMPKVARCINRWAGPLSLRLPGSSPI